MKKIVMILLTAFLFLFIGCSDNDKKCECEDYKFIDYEGYDPEIIWSDTYTDFVKLVEYDRWTFVDTDRETLVRSRGLVFRVFVEKGKLPDYAETKIANVVARDGDRIIDERRIEFYHNEEFDTHSHYAFMTVLPTDTITIYGVSHRNFIGRRIFFVAGEIPEIAHDDPVVQIIKVAYNHNAATNLKTVRNSFHVIFLED